VIRAIVLAAALLALSACASLQEQLRHPVLQGYELQCCEGGGGHG
jgi:hypothetical protein